jgi:hypothetical protein
MTGSENKLITAAVRISGKITKFLIAFKWLPFQKWNTNFEQP